jgi:transmembrane sensor
MSDAISDELLDRYLAGECTDAERVAVEAWASADASRVAMLEALRDSLGAPRSQTDTDAAWARLSAALGDDLPAASRREANAVPTAGSADVPLAPMVGRRDPASVGIDASDSESSGGPPPQIRWRRESGDSMARRANRKPFVRGLRIAAAIAALVLIGRALLDRPADDTPDMIGPRVTQTAAAERDTVRLPDGTMIVLAPASRIEVGTEFGHGIRAVHLTGVAFFDVAPDAEHPFRIDAGESHVVVLGTEFVVRSRPDTVIVAVREGRVSLGRTDADALTLTPGQVGRSTSGGTETLDADASTWLAWLDGVLAFDDATLSTVAAELGRWFGRDVRVDDDALAARRVVGRFTTTSLDDALDALTLTLGAHWQRDGDTYVIVPARSP